MKIHFTTVTYNIPFLFKDPEDIRLSILKELRSNVIESETYRLKHGDSKLKLIVVLDNKNKELRVLGPVTGDNIVDYTIWLPYKKIKNSSDYRIEYYNQLTQGLLEVFEKYDYNIEEIKSLFERLKTNVLTSEST